MRKSLLVIMIMVASLLLVACGAGEAAVSEPPAAEESAPEADVAEEQAEEPAEEAEQEAMDQSIVDIAVADGRFNTLVTAVTAAGLADTLSGEGEFTVFAPTDDAFAMLPEGTVDALLENPEDTLTDVLLYHVVDGAVPAETVVTLDSATTLNGEPVSISVVDGNVFLNEDVQVVTTDIQASNGIIHVIDGVLLPASVAEASDEEMADAASIAEIAVEDGRFTTLVTALDAAGLVDTLSADGEYTVFAPTDDAFAALPEGTVEALLADPQGALTDVLLYHVVDGAVPAEAVVTLDSATTLNGEDVTISVVDGDVFLNDDIQVVTTDIEASNGIIHVIDGVLVPASVAEASQEEMTGSIAEIAAADEQFSTLVTALDAAGLVETLSSEGEFTVFAPTNEAFASLPEGTVESLLEDPQGALTDVLLYHVVDGAVPAETVVTLDSATTLNGEDVAISVEDGSVFLNDGVQVIVTDIEASNGIIHVIDGVLVPTSVAEASDEEAMSAEDQMMAAELSIAEIASADEQFSTLVAALDAAGLVETFAGEGAYTVFAPTNDAFAQLPEGTVEALLEDPEGQLTDILSYHVVDGAVLAEDVVGLDAAPTLLGEDIEITITDEGEVFLNDTVQVTVTDIVASNGVIHVIDGVLLPPEAMTQEAPAMTAVSQSKGNSHTGAACGQQA